MWNFHPKCVFYLKFKYKVPAEEPCNILVMLYSILESYLIKIVKEYKFSSQSNGPIWLINYDQKMTMKISLFSQCKFTNRI